MGGPFAALRALCREATPPSSPRQVAVSGGAEGCWARRSDAIAAATKHVTGTSGRRARDLRPYLPRVSAGRLLRAGRGPVEVTEMMFWYGNAGWAFWQIALTWTVMIAFGGLLIWAVYALITSGRGKPGAGATGDGARQVLDERLARGEIDTGEYRRLRDTMAEADSGGKARAGSA